MIMFLNLNIKLCKKNMTASLLILLHLEKPILYTILAFLSAIGLSQVEMPSENKNRYFKESKHKKYVHSTLPPHALSETLNPKSCV